MKPWLISEFWIIIILFLIEVQIHSMLQLNDEMEESVVVPTTIWNIENDIKVQCKINVLLESLSNMKINFKEISTEFKVSIFTINNNYNLLVSWHQVVHSLVTHLMHNYLLVINDVLFNLEKRVFVTFLFVFKTSF